LHKPAKKNFETRKVYVHYIDQQWQVDLVEMREFSRVNKGFNYLLTVIDCFSKYSWAIPIKTKTGEEVSKALEKIFKERKPNKIQTDLGKEFYNSFVQKLFKKRNIIHFSTNSNVKASIVERFNRTLKEKMWKYFTEKETNKWIDVVDDLVFNYNNSFHRSIKMTPIEASKKENIAKVDNNLYGETKLEQVDSKESKKPKFKLGDKVRINKYKTIFDKGYLPNYTTEIFIVKEVLNDEKINYYKLKDLNNEDISGIFYEQELVLFNKEDDIYKIEKILKTRKRNGKIEKFVKWKGYPDSFNSWINLENFH